MSEDGYLKNLEEKYSGHVFGLSEAVLLIVTYVLSIFLMSALAASGLIVNEIILSVISYIFTFSLCIYVYIFKLKYTNKRLIFNIRSTGFSTYILVFPLMFGGMLISEYCVDLIPTTGRFFGEWWENINNIFEKMLKNSTYMILITCIFAPILEEILFRGILQKGLINKGILHIRAIFLSSFIFGVVHANPWQFISASILGVILGWVYHKTKTLLLPILLHAFNNIVSCILALNKKQSFADYLGISTECALIFGIVLVLIFGYLFYRTKKDLYILK